VDIWDRTMPSFVLGTDFDNTVVSYEHLFRDSAYEMGVAPPHEWSSKTELRSYIRSLPEGEKMWQRIQAEVYGRRMSEAVMNDGFEVFVECCRERSIPIYIISHKTEFAEQDPELNLRLAATDWMKDKGFFDKLGFSFSQVFFEATRKEKIARIQALNCTQFIDDMEEVFQDDSFPDDVTKILFVGEERSSHSGNLIKFSSWKALGNFLFAEGEC
jgi:hypothetical protein